MSIDLALHIGEAILGSPLLYAMWANSRKSRQHLAELVLLFKNYPPHLHIPGDGIAYPVGYSPGTVVDPRKINGKG